MGDHVSIKFRKKGPLFPDGAFSDQQTANALFLMSFAENQKLARRPYGGLMADSAPVLHSPSSAVAATEGG